MDLLWDTLYVSIMKHMIFSHIIGIFGGKTRCTQMVARKVPYRCYTASNYCTVDRYICRESRSTSQGQNTIIVSRVPSFPMCMDTPPTNLPFSHQIHVLSLQQTLSTLQSASWHMLFSQACFEPHPLLSSASIHSFGVQTKVWTISSHALLLIILHSIYQTMLLPSTS